MTVDKLVLALVVSVISAFIMVFVVGSIGLSSAGAILLTMFTCASGAFMPRDNSPIETRVNLKLAAIAAVIALVFTGGVVLLGFAPQIGSGIAVFVSCMTVNVIAIYTYKPAS